jgi:hypothetical protein
LKRRARSLLHLHSTGGGVDPDVIAVETSYQADPFWTDGLRRSVRVHHWAKAFWSPGFTECMHALGAAET